MRFTNYTIEEIQEMSEEELEIALSTSLRVVQLLDFGMVILMAAMILKALDWIGI